jgi:DNA-binding PadR family transcriptional regulator
MAIERYQRDRMELELAGYRSARYLGEHASWVFWDDNMARAIADGYFEEINNGGCRFSYYYRLTSKGRAMLKKAGKGFTYADARGRRPISYCRAGHYGYRWVKISRKERRAEADQLLAAFKGVVTSAAAHAQFKLEKKGWFPAKTTTPPSSLLSDGLIECQRRGVDGKTTYYRLTPKGKKALLEIRLEKLNGEQARARKEFKSEQSRARKEFKSEQSKARRALWSEQAATRRQLPSEIDVRDWGDFLSKT